MVDPDPRVPGGWYPEYPRLVIDDGNQMYATWFLRQDLSSPMHPTRSGLRHGQLNTLICRRRYAHPDAYFGGGEFTGLAGNRARFGFTRSANWSCSLRKAMKAWPFTRKSMII